MRPGVLFVLIWLFWLFSWIAAAGWSAPEVKRVSTWDVWAYRALIIVGAVLLNHRTAAHLGLPRLWHVGLGGAYALAGVAACGIAFTWWGRLHLGKLWSGSITRKEEHVVVDTGPYAVVRHPIYTGLLVAILASAAASATATAVAGAALGWAGFWLKARMEERFLLDELGGAYALYRRRVPMLVPFWPTPKG
jgi:protein-S-isoprenylcysteine O-methyltransferase Ste14